MSKKLTKEQTIRIIQLYRENECLWNFNKPSYKRKDLKNKALENIGKQLGISRDIAKDKIKNLRNTYVAERHKVQVSKSLAKGTDEIYEPRLIWYDEMEFLNSNITLRKKDHIEEISFQENTTTLDELPQSSENTPPKSTTPVVPQSQSIAAPTPMPSFEKRMIMVEAPKLDPQRFTYSIVLPPMNEIPTSPPKSNADEENPLKRSKQLARDSREKSFRELRGICEALNQPPPEENEFDCFGRSIACHLKKLPESLALESMGHIQSYLVEQRLRSIEEQ